MRVGRLRASAASLALVALLLLLPGPGAEAAEPTERTWGNAGEPVLHRLLRDLVRETREHLPCTQDGRAEPRPRARRPTAGGGARQRPQRTAPAAERCAAGPSTQHPNSAQPTQ